MSLRRTQIADTDDQIAKFATTSARLNRLLLGVVIAQSIMTLVLVASVGVGAFIISKTIADVDLNAISTILNSATHTALNAEEASELVTSTLLFATQTMNHSVQVIENINRLLVHPSLTISMQS